MRIYISSLSLIAFVSLGYMCSHQSVKVYKITSKASFEKRDDSTYMIVTDIKHKFDIFWSLNLGKGDMQYYPLTLDHNTTYTFTIEAERHKMKKFDQVYETYEVIKIACGNNVLYDREICEIHHRKMERREVPIIYGLVITPGRKPSAEQQRLLFPHHSESALGGCCVTPESPPKTMVFICPDCKAAYAKWRTEGK